ncbi:hypothetical protein BOX15_Mlig003414g3, partial [Macrostomum lignano]
SLSLQPTRLCKNKFCAIQKEADRQAGRQAGRSHPSHFTRSSTLSPYRRDEKFQKRFQGFYKSTETPKSPASLPGSMAGTKRSYRFVRRATGDDDGDADGRVPDEGEAALLQLRGNWERQNRLLHDTRLQGAATAALTVPVPTSRYYRQSVSEMAYRGPLGGGGEAGATSYRTQLLDRREQNNQLKDAFRGRIDRLNNNREVMLQEREALREQRRQFDRRPLSPPFVDDTLPKTFQYRWEKIGSRVPGDPEVYRRKHPEPVVETVQLTRQQLAAEEARVRRRRQELARRREFMRRPYAGELGIDTYEPWQLPAYYACRQIVLDEVERVLDLVLGERHESIEALNRDTQAAVWSGAVQLVCEELLLEVTGELGQLAGREFLYLKGLAANLADQSCMRQAEAAIVGQLTGRKPSEPEYEVAVRTFYKLKRQRSIEKPLLWRHGMKKSSALPAAPAATKQVVPEVEDTSEIIDYTQLLPWDTRLQLNERIEPDYVGKKNMIKLKKFASQELRYWKQIVCNYTGISLLGFTGGFSCASVSNDNRLVAVGTMRGDLLVYDFDRKFKGGNFVVFRYSPVSNEQQQEQQKSRQQPSGRQPQTVDSLAWSADSGNLVSVHASGDVRAWSVHYAPLSPEQQRQPAAGKNSAAAVSPLNILGDIPAHELRFTEGPFAAESAAATRPDTSWQAVGCAFFPAFTVMGSQPHFCLAMSSHHVIKLDTEQLLDDVQESQSQVLKWPRLRDPRRLGHKITDLRIDCELFVEHSRDLLLMGAIENTGDFFTVDSGGYLVVWRYRAEFLADARRGMRPLRVHRIRMDKEKYRPDPATPAMVRFDAEAYNPETERTELAEARRRAEAEARRNQLRYPWRTQTEFSQVTTIYKSPLEAVKQSGGAFHEVTRLKVDDRMMRYITRVYKPYIFEAEMFLGARLDRTGTRLVCLILFPTDPEDEEHHIEVCIVDLGSMKPVDPRIIIPLTEKEYAEIQQTRYVNFDITGCFNYTLSAYLLVNVMGKVTFYSLTSGQRVAVTLSQQQVESESFRGCVINRSIVSAHHSNQIHCIANQHDTGMLVFRPGELTARLLYLQDGNSERDRRSLAESLRGFDWNTWPKDRANRSSSDALYLADPDHPYAFCMDIVYDMMDRAVQRSRGSTFTAETIAEHEDINRLKCYERLNGRLERLRRRQAWPGPPPDTDYVKRRAAAAAAQDNGTGNGTA